jgi:serine O-acetyltransferase
MDRKPFFWGMPLSNGDLKEDLDRYFILLPKSGFFQRLRVATSSEGIWVLISYRLGRGVRLRVHVPIVRGFLKAVTLVFHFMIRVVTKIDIPFDADIGPGLYIGHSGYIVINPQAKLGAYCNLSPGVVIGEAGRGDKRGVPQIGCRVYFGPGAKVFGRILIGDNVAIGANAVVCEDVPDNAVVGGVPARVLSYKGSGDFVTTRKNA